MTKQKLKRILFISAGSAALALGTIGILIPLLPTTPFLLLACGCYLRGSSRLHHWLLGHKLFGPYLYNYLVCKAVTRRSRAAALLFLWGGLTVSAVLLSGLHLRLLLLAVGIGVTIHLIKLKTLPINNSP